MKRIQFLTILSFSGLVACNNQETNPRKLIRNESIKSTQNEKKEVLTTKANTNSDSLKDNRNLAFRGNKQGKKNSHKKSKEVSLAAEAVQPNEQSNIVLGYVRNVFIENGDNYFFQRIVKQDEDKRVGCSGGENELSFTITNPADTFLIENERLQTLNFKYRVNGGLYWAEGSNPYKGKIKGRLLPDSTWQIEVNLWLKLKDLQLNKEIEKQIIMNDKFVGKSPNL